MLPKDPMILLSYVNTQLRNRYPSLEELCEDLDKEAEEIKNTLKRVGYEYDPVQNRFV